MPGEEEHAGVEGLSATWRTLPYSVLFVVSVFLAVWSLLRVGSWWTTSVGFLILALFFVSGLFFALKGKELWLLNQLYLWVLAGIVAGWSLSTLIFGTVFSDAVSVLFFFVGAAVIGALRWIIVRVIRPPSPVKYNIP